jgi:hypothetical protein
LTKLIFCAVAVTGLLMHSTDFAYAAPPASCASKFVGTWAYPGGVTEVRADGTAYPKCPMCVPMQTWTCSGNTYFFNNPGSYTATLSPDGRQLIGTVTATRIGGSVRAPRVARPSSANTTEPRSPSPTVNVTEPRLQTPTVNSGGTQVRTPTVRQ